MVLSKRVMNTKNVYSIYRISCRVLLCACLLLFSWVVVAEVKVKVRSGFQDVNENVLAHVGEIKEEELQNLSLLRRRVSGSAQKALNALGFYEGQVTVDVIKGGAVYIGVTPGEPVLWRNIKVSVEGYARQQPVFETLMTAPLLNRGERLKHWQYEKTKIEITQTLARYGYMDARLAKAELLIDVGSHTADVLLTAISGKRYQFGDIEFKQEGLSRNLLNRMLGFESGELYDNEKVAELRKSLSLSGYFDEVQVLVKKQPDFKVDVLTLLKVKKSHYIDVGLGFSTDTKLRGRLGWRWPVSGEYGGALSAQSEISEPKKEVSLNYRLPLLKPLTQSLDFDYGWQDKSVESARTILTTFGAAINNRKENNWQHRYGISIDYERHSPSQGDTEKSFFLVPSLGWSRTDVNDPIDPDSGYFISFGLAGSHPGIGSDTQFLKGTMGARWLTKLYTPSLVFVSRIDLGAIWTDNIEQVPFSRRFFAGGDQSIRGFEYESIASRDDDGNLIGGKFLNVGSLELNYKALEEWRFGLFFDVGRAFNDLDEPFYSSAGPSARWLSPVGQIRLDIAFPLKGEDTSDPRVHLSMGGVF